MKGEVSTGFDESQAASLGMYLCMYVFQILIIYTNTQFSFVKF